MQIKPLTKIDVSNRKPTDPGILWLLANGFKYQLGVKAVYMVKG